MRILALFILCVAIGLPSSGSATAAEKADKKTKGSKSGKVSRSLNSKLVGEADLDELTVTGKYSPDSCEQDQEQCDPSDPQAQDKAPMQLPSSAGMSFIAQEEARAAGARLPAQTNPNINFFQTVR